MTNNVLDKKDLTASIPIIDKVALILQFLQTEKEKKYICNQFDIVATPILQFL